MNLAAEMEFTIHDAENNLQKRAFHNSFIGNHHIIDLLRHIITETNKFIDSRY